MNKESWNSRKQAEDDIFQNLVGKHPNDYGPNISRDHEDLLDKISDLVNING